MTFFIPGGGHLGLLYTWRSTGPLTFYAYNIPGGQLEFNLTIFIPGGHLGFLYTWRSTGPLTFYAYIPGGQLGLLHTWRSAGGPLDLLHTWRSTGPLAFFFFFFSFSSLFLTRNLLTHQRVRRTTPRQTAGERTDRFSKHLQFKVTAYTGE